MFDRPDAHGRRPWSAVVAEGYDRRMDLALAALPELPQREHAGLYVMGSDV
jgi:hypothetical protein